jgi:hypothetical protein
VESEGIIEDPREREPIFNAWQRLLEALGVSRALSSGNVDLLAQAIDRAEKRGLIPHAARMRIVLGEMTGDPGPLGMARSVLERLEDRQFLRRLGEVEAAMERAS